MPDLLAKRVLHAVHIAQQQPQQIADQQLPDNHSLERTLKAVVETLRTLPHPERLKTALPMVDAQLVSLPDCIELLFLRATILDDLGLDVEACTAYAAVLKRSPIHRGALNNCGNRLFAAGQLSAARELYIAAVKEYPNDPMSLTNLATFYLKNELMCRTDSTNLQREQNELQLARQHFEHALTIDPNCQQAHIGLSIALVDLGEAEQAAFHRRMAFQGRYLTEEPYRGKQAPITVLNLVSSAPGSVRMKDYLDDHIFKSYNLFVEFYEPGIKLPPHDLVINAIGDAEISVPGLTKVSAVLDCTSAPVINPPAAIWRTTRAEVARRLSGIPGVVTAKTVNLTKASLSTAEAPATLSREGFNFPFLLRSPGCHGGTNFLSVENFDELAARLPELPGEELLVIEYLNAAEIDGKSRKYRVMFIDGQLYPLHLAISSQWKIHYFSADMTDHPEYRAEEETFLANMAGVLGPKAMAALRKIEQAQELDYGGIDFALNRNGEILLFEANATMAVIRPDPDKQWDYRRPAVERIYKAVQAMLINRATATAKPWTAPEAAAVHCG